MAKISRKKIVEEQMVYSDIEIDEIVFRETFIYDIFSDQEKAIEFLAKMKLIKNSMLCSKCGPNTDMAFQRKKGKIDGFIWSCTYGCSSWKSIRHGSFFDSFKLTLKEVFIIIHKYLKKENLISIAHELDINRKTVTRYTEMLRDVILEEVESNNERLGGYDEHGRPKIVEIDESLFFKSKYNRGRNIHGQWYVGGVERGSKKAFLVPVSNRNTETMIRILRDNVLPGTIIITDQWRAYDSALRNMSEFTHLTVNHSLNFVNPLDRSVHTQGVEGFWSQSKRCIHERHGIMKNLHIEYLLQFL